MTKAPSPIIPIIARNKAPISLLAKDGMVWM